MRHLSPVVPLVVAFRLWQSMIALVVDGGGGEVTRGCLKIEARGHSPPHVPPKFPQLTHNPHHLFLPLSP